VLNTPGSWHDSQAAASLVSQCHKHIGEYALCVDQGFPRSGELEGIFVGPMSKKKKRKLAPILAPLLILLSNVHVSLRQASEWGMRSLEGTFSRLKTRLSCNKFKRRSILLSVILLHNYRTHVMGINQIAKVFDPEHPQYINIGGYDRLRRYFNF
jgi:hypothetical protein